ncbi:MAG: hypothetical protein ACTSO7_11350 [Candidatus Heimdallarchaeota archaeon]
MKSLPAVSFEASGKVSSMVYCPESCRHLPTPSSVPPFETSSEPGPIGEKPSRVRFNSGLML